MPPCDRARTLLLLSTLESSKMHRRAGRHDQARISDVELGIASLLLFLAVVLAVVLVPALA